MPKKKKNEIEVVFESAMNLDDRSGIFTPTEREIILADMAYLIQKEKENGDWDKWLKSQEPWKKYEQSSELRTMLNAQCYSCTRTATK